jgi:transcription initiation factor TFIIE subunit alpha
MEVLDYPSAEGFRCHKCRSVLTHDLDRNSVGHQKSTRMNNQFKFITDLLPRIDAAVVPENTFDLALAKARPVVRDHTHQVASSVSADPAMSRPTAVKGLANTGPKSMQVNISTSDGPSEADLAAERARKEKIAQQNALPAWMANSTVTGEAFSATAAAAGAAAGGAGGTLLAGDDADTKDASGKTALEAKDDAEIDDYFARLKAEQEAEEARKAAARAQAEAAGDYGSEEDEEDDEDDFEDVVASGSNSGTGTGTPASPVGASLNSKTLPVVPSPLRQASNSSLKRDAAASASSNTNSASTSPSANQTPSSEGRPLKKVKVEEPPPLPVDEGESEEEDLEFEDV